MLTQEQLKSKFSYNPDTGIFTRLRNNREYKSIDSCGYVHMAVCGYKIRAHRLAWLYIHGYIPRYIDHINGVRFDNRLINLRECTQQENMFNQKPMIGKISKYKGVSFHKPTNKWRAYGKLNQKNIHLGLHKTEQEAFMAYDNFAKANHGKFYRPQI